MSEGESGMKFFHQRKWIATNFHVKSNLNAILKNRFKTAETLRQHHSHGVTPIHFKSTQLAPDKPFTAPHRLRSNAYIQPSREPTPMTLQHEEVETLQSEPQWQTSGSSFKATLSHRRQMLFMKPYSRNRNTSLTIDQTKREVYKQINNPDLQLFDSAFPAHSQIQYLTEFSQPFQRTKNTAKTVHHKHRTSLNVLKEKLKRRSDTQIQNCKLSTRRYQ